MPALPIDAVILSHAHIDHSGNLPFAGEERILRPIYSTPATVDLCNWMLRDTAHIQEQDAEFFNNAGTSQGARLDNGLVAPLYTMADAERTLPLFRPVPYHTPHALWRPA